MVSDRPLIFVVLDTPATWFGVSAPEKAVLTAIVACMNRKRNGCEVWPGIELICERTGLGRRTVIRARKQLHDLGLIKVRQDSGRKSVTTIDDDYIRALADPKNRIMTSARAAPVNGKVIHNQCQSGTSTSARAAPDQCQSGTLTTKEQQKGTANGSFPLGCSLNPKIVSGPGQRQMRMVGIADVAGNVMADAVPGQEQPKGEKPEWTGTRQSARSSKAQR